MCIKPQEDEDGSSDGDRDSGEEKVGVDLVLNESP